jgi:hypothetical protein
MRIAFYLNRGPLTGCSRIVFAYLSFWRIPESGLANLASDADLRAAVDACTPCVDRRVTLQ